MQPWQATLNNFTLNNNKTAHHWIKICRFWREIKPYLLSLSITSSSHCMSLSMIWFTWWYLCSSWPHDWEQSAFLPTNISSALTGISHHQTWWNMRYVMSSLSRDYCMVKRSKRMNSMDTFNVFCKTIILFIQSQGTADMSQKASSIPLPP